MPRFCLLNERTKIVPTFSFLIVGARAVLSEPLSKAPTTDMKIHRALCLFLACLFSLASCQTSHELPARQRAYVPRVQLPDPDRLSPAERRHLHEFESALADAGYRPVQSSAEYQAEFDIAEGPINVDTRMRLLREGQPVAEASARHGGPAKLFQGAKYVEQSFLKCLAEFEARLPRAGGSSDGGWNDSGRSGYDGRGYPAPQPAPRWQTERY